MTAVAHVQPHTAGGLEDLCTVRPSRWKAGVVVSILVLLLIVTPLFPRTSDLPFEHISIDRGLSQSSVFTVFQDSKGFLWIGTLDGLNKYDGYRFTVYRTIPRDSTTLSGNTVFKILEDKNGFLWIGTLGGGLNRYDRKTERFMRFRHLAPDPTSLSDDNVRSLFEDAEGRLWVGTNNGLNLYQPESRNFRRIVSEPGNRNSLSNNAIWSLHETPAAPGILWIGTYNGLNRLDVAAGRFEHYTNDVRDPGSISNNYVWSIVDGEEGELWVGTNYGLNRFDIAQKRFTRYLHDPARPGSISNNNVWALARSHTGALLVGTLGGGFNIMDGETVRGQREPVFRRFAFDPTDPQSLSQDFVWSLLVDRSGIIWIGTDGGLNKFDPARKKFVHHRNLPFDPNSLSNNEVTALHKDRQGIVWIGTRNGLNRFSEGNGTFLRTFARPGSGSGLSSNYIRSIMEDRTGNLWVGTGGGGVNIRPPGTSTFWHLRAGNAPGDLSSNDVTAICEDRDGIIWLGTLSGLNRYDPTTRTITRFLHDPGDPASLSHDYVYTVYETRDRTLWVGTFGGGLNRFDRTSGSFQRYMESQTDTNSLSNNNIWCLYEDPGHDLWIGTNNGLDRFDRTRGVFRHYSEADGLQSNVIYGIQPDGRGNLWISSNNGLASFNPVSGAVRTYTTGDGLQSNQFGGNAATKDERGWMYFGGINGFNVFSPDSIQDNPMVPPIVFTDFLVFNISMHPGVGSPIDASIVESPVVRLSHAQNVFSFEFAALHYSAPEANRYAYKMEGFDRDWIQAGARRFATYTNLDHGTYVFRVIGSNCDGIWNREGASVTIIISPPFWQTWWFIVLALLAVASVAGALIHFRVRNLLSFERLRLEIAADLHDDIGTRLTEISFLSDMAVHQKPEETGALTESLRRIGGIARALIDSMGDIVWLINPERDSLYELFIKLKDSYEDILSFKQVTFHLNNLNSLQDIVLPMEFRKHVYLIFKEALSNALKYSACSEISINTEVHGNQLRITMYDNGRGFDMQVQRRGNGLRDMERRAEACGGTLRLQSAPGKGTMLRFAGRIGRP